MCLKWLLSAYYLILRPSFELGRFVIRPCQYLVGLFCLKRARQTASHWAHKVERSGSIPPPATNFYCRETACPVSLPKPLAARASASFLANLCVDWGGAWWDGRCSALGC
jgi:hypothetical protein